MYKLADLSIDSIRFLTNYNVNINAGAIFSKEDRNSVFIQSRSEFELTRSTDKEIATSNKEIEYIKQAVKGKECIISMLEKN